MDHDQPTSFALLIVVGLEEGKCLCRVNVSWREHLSLAAQRNKYVDFTTQKRIPKDSFYFLKNMLKLLIIFHQENNCMLVMSKAHF